MGWTRLFRRLLDGLWQDLRALDERVKDLDREIEIVARLDPIANLLQQLRGVGPVIATAIVANVGDAKQFSNGRQLAASLGLTPRQHSSGGRERLLGISKWGDAYLRTFLIHGARSMLADGLESVQLGELSAAVFAKIVRSNGHALEAMPYDPIKEMESLALDLEIAQWTTKTVICRNSS